jgi:3-phosphoshikimate 1-carboxyvinyltransferase
VPSDLLRPLDSLPDPLPIATIPPDRARAIRSVVRPPGSKSLTNRALLLAALASGESRLHGALTEADDAERMLAALGALGAGVSLDAPGEVAVRGVRGRWPVAHDGVELNLHNAGTATRFLAAASALAAGPVTIDGNARMRQRPIGELAAVMPSLGVQVEYLGTHGYPPLRLHPPRHPVKHAALELLTTKSSQFISALLMLGPWLEGGITLRLRGEVTSPPYIAMTLRLLDRLGAVTRSSEDLRVLRVGPPDGGAPGLPPFEYLVEPDASGATYFWAAGAVLPGACIGVEGLGGESLQGDAAFPTLLRRMGATVETDDADTVRVTGPDHLVRIDADMTDMPDAAMTIAAVCAFAPGRSVLRGLRTLRVKETDRVAAIQNELRKLGVRVEHDVPEDPDALSITPPEGGVDCSPTAPRVEFDTYDDHRMAMSMALVGLRRPNCFIRDPGCVRKTYPGFWADLTGICL